MIVNVIMWPWFIKKLLELSNLSDVRQIVEEIDLENNLRYKI